jgi:uncharacterized peroxidase-related enzyme
MSSPKLNVNANTFSEKSNDILEASQKKLGFVPNMYMGMAGNASTLDSYSYAYDSFRKNSGFNAAEQEVVLLSISYVNNCSYCVAAHSVIGDMTKVPTSIIDAIREGIEIPDEKLNALSTFTKKMVEKRGWASQDDLDAFFKVGYEASHVLGIITGIAVKTISNYSNHLTQPELDLAFNGRKWSKNK